MSEAKNFHFAVGTLIVLCAAAPAIAQPQRRPSEPMGGPYVHRVESASSVDGLNFKPDGQVLLKHASVPATVVLPDGRIRIYYVDAARAPETANVAESRDGGKTFTPLGLVITNRAKSKALDPAIVALPDGRWRLYYFACDQSPDHPGSHEIHAAISTDGVHFSGEGKVFEREGLVDPDVFWNGKEWLMFVFSGAERDTIMARSSDGLKFTYAGSAGVRGWGTVAPFRLDDGRFRMFAFRQGSQREIGSFISTDGIKWTQEPGVRLTVTEAKQITDPFVVRVGKQWKMFFKIEDDLRNRRIALPQTESDLFAPRPLPNRPNELRPPPQNNGPWNRDLVAYDSADGITFTNRRTFVERAGVPCVVRDASGRLVAVFQSFPADRQEAFDKVAVVFSSDNGKTWTKPAPIRVAGLPEGAQRPFDPTLVLLDDRRLRLYFTCTVPSRRTPGIYSAISTNGLEYSFEPGLRFGVEGEPTVDPAITRLGKTWHLFSPVQGAENRGHHATSDDGLNFRELAKVNVPVRGSWIGNAITDDDKLWFYGSGGDAGWLASSTDGAKWQVVSQNLRVGGDPALVKLNEKQFLLIATGENRPTGNRRPAQPGPPWNQPAPFRDEPPRRN